MRFKEFVELDEIFDFDPTTAGALVGLAGTGAYGLGRAVKGIYRRATEGPRLAKADQHAIDDLRAVIKQYPIDSEAVRRYYKSIAKERPHLLFIANDLIGKK